MIRITSIAFQKITTRFITYVLRYTESVAVCVVSDHDSNKMTLSAEELDELIQTLQEARQAMELKKHNPLYPTY